MYVFVHVVHKRCTGLHSRPEAVYVESTSPGTCAQVFLNLATGSEHMVN